MVAGPRYWGNKGLRPLYPCSCGGPVTRLYPPCGVRTGGRKEKSKKDAKKKRERRPEGIGKKISDRQLPGRFELPSTDSESVVIAATLRELGHAQLVKTPIPKFLE